MRGSLALIIAAALAGCSPTTAPAPAPPTPAQSAAAKAALEGAGLIGTWATDCRGPAASTGWEEIFVNPQGVPQTRIKEGEFRATFNVVEAKRLGPSEVQTTIVNVDRTAQRLTTVYRLEPGRQMTWSSANAEGKPLVRDGVMPSGSPSKWYHRCAEGTPIP